MSYSSSNCCTANQQGLDCDCVHKTPKPKQMSRSREIAEKYIKYHFPATMFNQILLFKHLEEDLEQYAKEVREETIRESIEIIKKHIGDKLCECENKWVQHYPWNGLLPPQVSLLNQKEK